MNPSALNDYIVEVQHKPFEWGVHDCLIFSNTAWQRTFGFGWADDWLGKYMVDGKPISPRMAKSVFGYANLDAALRIFVSIIKLWALHMSVSLPWQLSTLRAYPK